MAIKTSITEVVPEPLKKVEKKGAGVRMGKDRAETGEAISLEKSLLNILNGPKDSIERLAFEVDPTLVNKFQAIYRAKLRLLPDTLLKRIMIQDDLVAAIVRARETHVSSFGRPRPDRFSTGYVIEANPGVIDRLSPEEKAEMEKRIETAVKLIATCGHTEEVKSISRLSFSEYLMLSARNAVGLGRIATEVIHTTDPQTNEKKFHCFRPVDAGTIYKAANEKAAEDQVRKQALKLLESLKNEKFIPEKFQNDEYAWIQVVDGRPLQAFTAEELLHHNFFPVLDIELDGYPVTPIDTMISAVTTHINITTHNKIYFQSGRAARGMLVFKSDDVDENTLSRVKQEFNARINSVNNAWRMPVFAVGTNDEISWESIDQGGRDAEFQYLTDMNARVILSAFQMSPDELPGWSYLSRGTNNQALSESNNEYKMEAARDLGIRPLLHQFEDFINSHLFPLIDANLAKICRLKLKGLDADTEEKESVRLQQDMPVHMTYDQVLEKVEKKPVGKEFGGEFPINPQFQAIIDKYLTVGVIVEKFFGIANASKDPNLQYIRDPFWFNFQQLQQQAQAAQQAQQAAAGGGEGEEGSPGAESPEGEGQDEGGKPSEGDKPKTANQKNDQAGAPAPTAQPAQQPGEDLTRSIDQAISVLTKGEQSLPRSKQKLLAQHRRTIQNLQATLESDSRESIKEILGVTDKHKKKS